MKKLDVNKIIEIITLNIKNAEITSVKLDDNLTELGMDSIMFIQVIVEIEEEFKCEIPDEKLLITEMNSIQKIIDVLQELSGEANN